jgi:hypothetical protein
MEQQTRVKDLVMSRRLQDRARALTYPAYAEGVSGLAIKRGDMIPLSPFSGP